jgi:UDP-N-acetylmuramoylalanine--D-glutamate ligase
MELNSSPNGKQGPDVWVGGNIGTPLISILDQIKQNDLAVMELSSFQLELMTRSPQIAAVLNITPNHLDRHGSMENYTQIKGRILQYQEGTDAAVLGRDDSTAWKMAQNVHSNLWSFGFHKQDLLQRGTYLAAEGIFLRAGAESQDLHVVHPGDIKLRGEHNLLNTLAACAIAAAAGLPVKAMREGIRSFEGIPHRLEFVRNWGGADWYNDSIATAPERAMAAIRSFDDPIILLAGGRNKDLPWDDFAKLANERVKHLIVFGEAAEVIIHAINDYQQIPAREIAAGNKSFHQLPITKLDRMEDAVLAAAKIVQPGDVVLLSPGGTSFDQFKDFEERGECFAQLVKDLT